MTISESITAESAKTPRSTVLTDAAIRVLAENGSRGLTHRAVDTEAGLPEGSTSNLFRTRAELMSAILEAHVERELAIMDGVGAMNRIGTVEEAASLIATVIETLSSDASRYLVTARYEIYLEGLRQEPFRPLLAQVRARFIAIVTDILNDLKLPSNKYVAEGFASFVDGLTAAEVFHPGSSLSTKELKALITAFLNGLKAL